MITQRSNKDCGQLQIWANLHARDRNVSEAWVADFILQQVTDLVMNALTDPLLATCYHVV
jgi:hypothetical protein